MIPLEDKNAPRAPFSRGSVPQAGWFCIETTFRHGCPNLPGMLSAHGLPVPQADGEQLALAVQHGLDTELATEETLRGLVERFNALEAAGRGLLLTRDHAGMKAQQDTRACGWLRALQADGGKLWAWIELTPFGHAMVNGGEYTYFSTEYDYADFERTDGGATPTRLIGCTLTNMPRHAAQTPCTNMCSAAAGAAVNPENHNMDNEQDKKEDTAATNADDVDPKDTQVTCDTPDTKPEPAAATRMEEDKDPAAANSDVQERQDPAAMNEDDTLADGPDMESACIAVAELLELPETATPADLLDAVKKLVTSNEELRTALAEANRNAGTEGGVAGNSRRYPHLSLNSRRPARTALNGKKPNATVNVKVGGSTIAVNSQEKLRADYCTAAVNAAEKALGRTLTPAEYNRTYAQASEDYANGNR